MTVTLGMFTMPFHHPDRDYAAILEEDQEVIVLADRLGFTEVYVGEHFSSWSERITSPLIFLATVIPRTKQIRLGTDVTFYYRFFHYSFSRARKTLCMLKPDLEVRDEDVTPDDVKRALMIAGSPGRVLDQLVALRDEIGPFGTLLMAGHD